MLFKLCKMEFKQSWRPFVLLYVLLLISSVFSGMNGENGGVFTGIMLLVYMSSIFAVMILVLVNIIQNYHKSMFGRNSYLTHTLPVTSTQLLISKIVCGLFWGVASIIIVFVTILLIGILVTGDVGEIINLGKNLDFSIEFEGFLLIINMILEYIKGILLFFFVITCVHTCYIRKYRVACAIGIYALINIILSFTLDKVFVGSSGLNVNMFFFFGNSNIFFRNDVLISLAINLILCCAYFFATKYFLDHKLEVE